MKKLSNYLVFALVCAGLVMFNSCEKEDVLSSSLNKTNELDGYFVRNGILCFKSGIDFINLNKELSQMDADEFEKWEASLGFKSFYTEYYALVEKVNRVNNIDEYDRLVNGNIDLIIQKDSIVLPKIDIPSYQRTANRNGLLIIDDVLLHVDNEHLTAYDNDCIDNRNEMLEIISQDNFTDKIKLNKPSVMKSANCGNNIDMSSIPAVSGTFCEKLKKCQFRAHIHTVPVKMGNTNDYLYYYEVTVATIALAKNCFQNAFWEYESIHHHNNDVEVVVEVEVVDPCTNCVTTEEKKLSRYYSESSGYCKFKHWFEKENILGADNYFDDEPAPPFFKRIKGEFWTQGSYPNKVLVNCGYQN